MFDKYSKIQDLISLQQKRRDAILKVFESIFCSGENSDFKLDKIPKIEIEFGNEKTTNLIKIKIKDKSSIKFLVLQNQLRIKEEYQKINPKEILKIY